MSEQREQGAPLHFLKRTTTDKLCRDLDLADAQGLNVLVVQHVGGRDWVLVTRDAPIVGPAGSRVFSRSEE